MTTVRDDLAAKLDEHTAAVVVQSPNFFGAIDHYRAAADLAAALARANGTRSSAAARSSCC